MRHEYENNENSIEKPAANYDVANATPKTVWYHQAYFVWGEKKSRLTSVPNSCRAYRILHFEKCATQPGICINLL